MSGGTRCRPRSARCKAARRPSVFVAVQDVEATLKRAEELGGKTIQPATAVPGVTFGVLCDAQGHTVGVAAN